MEMTTSKYKEEVYLEYDEGYNDILLGCTPLDGCGSVCLTKKEALEIAIKLIELANK